MDYHRFRGGIARQHGSFERRPIAYLRPIQFDLDGVLQRICESSRSPSWNYRRAERSGDASGNMAFAESGGLAAQLFQIGGQVYPASIRPEALARVPLAGASRKNYLG